MVTKNYPTKLQLYKASYWYRSPIFYQHQAISNGFVSSKIYDKLDGFDFDNFVNFLYLDGDVPSAPSYCVNISQLILFA